MNISHIHGVTQTSRDIRARNTDDGSRPKIVVVHAMGEFIASPALNSKVMHAPAFLEKIGLSAHAFIDSRGDIFLGVPTAYAAWHAKGHNLMTVGVEFLVPGVYANVDELHDRLRSPWLTKAQWEAGVYWMEGQEREFVVGHDQIDASKPDPGPFFPIRQFAEATRTEVYGDRERR